MVQLPSLHLWPLSSFNQIPLNPKGTSFDISFSGPVFYLRFYHTLYPFYASSLEPSTCFIIISRRPQNLGFSSHPAPLLLIRTSLQVLALQRESNSIDVRQQRTAFPPNFVHSLDGFTHDDDDSSCLQGRWPTFCRGA